MEMVAVVVGVVGWRQCGNGNGSSGGGGGLFSSEPS
jgi:hypothetical protein